MACLGPRRVGRKPVRQLLGVDDVGARVGRLGVARSARPPARGDLAQAALREPSRSVRTGTAPSPTDPTSQPLAAERR